MELPLGTQLEKRLEGTVGTGKESCWLGSEVLGGDLAGWPGMCASVPWPWE